jgi:hypothetical protein
MLVDNISISQANIIFIAYISTMVKKQPIIPLLQLQKQRHQEKLSHKTASTGRTKLLLAPPRLAIHRSSLPGWGRAW